MYIVLDSNIWISEWGLNTNLGATVQFYINQKSAQIALPEVVKEEVERNINANLEKLCAEMEKKYRQLLSVFTNLNELVLPNQHEIDQQVRSIFSKHKIEYKIIPLTLKSAKFSLEKINKKEPPSGRNQQFKDGVIWSNCLTLLEDDDVLFVTEDKAFFEGYDYKNGLSKILKKEIEDTKYEHKLKIYPNLIDLLEAVKDEIADIQIDKRSLENEFLLIVGDIIDSMLEENGFSISSDARVSTSLFITEKPSTM